MDQPRTNFSNFLAESLCNIPPNWPNNWGKKTQQDFIQASRKQGLQPLLYYRISNCNPTHLWPSKVMAALTQEAMHSTAVDMLIDHELNIILDALGNLEIHPILLKGSALTHTHYPRPGLRPRTDTDLLIRRGDVAIVSNTLEELEYHFVPPLGLMGQEFSFTRTIGQAGARIILDIHWRISSQSLLAQLLTYNEASDHAVPVPELGQNARTLSPAHALLFACIHRARHQAGGDQESLLWVYDIHLLITQMSTQTLEQFAALAIEKKVAKICLSAIHKTQELFATSVPLSLTTPLEKISMGEPSARLLDTEGSISFRLSDLITISGWRNQLASISDCLIPPAAYMQRIYNPSSKPTSVVYCYFRRLYDGAKKWLLY